MFLSASADDLIIHKIFAGRPRDIEDSRLVILKNPDLDVPYFEKWLKAFDDASDDRPFLSAFRKISGICSKGD